MGSAKSVPSSVPSALPLGDYFIVAKRYRCLIFRRRGSKQPFILVCRDMSAPYVGHRDSVLFRFERDASLTILRSELPARHVSHLCKHLVQNFAVTIHIKSVNK